MRTKSSLRCLGISVLSLLLVSAFICGCVAIGIFKNTYKPRVSLPEKIPGTFRIMVKADPKSRGLGGGKLALGPGGSPKAEMIRRIKENIAADLKANVFDSAERPVTDIEVMISEFDPFLVSISLTMFVEGSQIAGFEAKKEPLAPVFSQPMVTLGTVMDDIKSQMEQGREVIIARMKSPRPSLTAGTAAGKAAGGGSMNLAVAQVAAEGVSAGTAAVVSDWLRGALVGTNAFNVVERGNMEKILAEHAFQQTGCTSDECAVKLGKILNVQRMVVGSFGKFMTKYVLNVRVVDVESGQIVYSDSAKGASEDEIEKEIKLLAGRLAGG